MRYLSLLAMLLVIGCAPSRKDQYQEALAKLNEETELHERMQRELAAFDAETRTELDSIRQTLDRQLQALSDGKITLEMLDRRLHALGDGQIAIESICKDAALDLSDLEQKQVVETLDMAKNASIRLREERVKKREFLATVVEQQRDRVHQAKEKQVSLSDAAN
ncbi:hypothetical protein SH528x_003539 [Novipirellula sp. SH528]|uniref:hypothetical protein n=1 Tax=Novipirellula sp. SH528 TaxID=3454466 RepID=UPI003FA15E16